VEVKYFTGVHIIYNNEIDLADENIVFQLIDAMTKSSSSSNSKFDSDKSFLEIKHFLIKVILTVVYNSEETIVLSNLTSIVNKFNLSKKKIETDEEKKETEENVNTMTKPENEIEIRRECLQTILEIIDCGLDKSYSDFQEDLSLISSPLIKTSENSGGGSSAISNWPITELRDYLKPLYLDKKAMSHDGREDRSGKIQNLNIYKDQKDAFEYIYSEYFQNFDPDKLNTVYKNYRIKYLMIEDEKAINFFIDHLWEFYNRPSNKLWLKYEEHYGSFWSKFIKEKDDFELNYLVYIVPYTGITNFNLNDSNKSQLSSSLSVFLMGNDEIYRKLVYQPWVASKDYIGNTNASLEENNNSSSNSKNEILGPTKEMNFSTLKLPLDLYISEASNIFELKLYKYATEKSKGLFWKNMFIKFEKKSENIIKNKNEDSTTCSIRMYCVDLLGVHYKDQNKNDYTVLNLSNVDEIKIFNMFFRKDQPFNFNNKSNNGWLEVFVTGIILFI
jgi:hypothetical protein